MAVDDAPTPFTQALWDDTEDSSAREVLNLSSIFRSGPVVCGEAISCEERDVALRHFLGALPVLPVLPVGGAWLKAFPWRKGILSRKLRPPRQLQALQQG